MLHLKCNSKTEIFDLYQQVKYSINLYSKNYKIIYNKSE